MDNSRISKKQVDIDDVSIKKFYAKRAREKVDVNIDAPVVLCSDNETEKISVWNEYEERKWLPKLKIDSNSRIFFFFFGTGRVTKYLLCDAVIYVGIDYVKEFVNIARNRKDIPQNEKYLFLHDSFRECMNNISSLPYKGTFNRFVDAGGVLMYMNDDDVRFCIEHLVEILDGKCVLYFSEPIGRTERFTLNKYYSKEVGDEYSAIYRTVDEYIDIFTPLLNAGFHFVVNQEFFDDDIKGRKETVQWLFVLEN